MSTTNRKRSRACAAAGLFLGALTACARGLPTSSPVGIAQNTSTAIPVTRTVSASRTATVPPAAPTVTLTPSETPTPTPSPTPTLDPDAWQNLPAVAAVTGTARKIYAGGQAIGNDPHAFSVLGDCLSLSFNLFGNFGQGPGYYNLGDYTYLQPVIDWFVDSFKRQSLSLGSGFTTAVELSALWADPHQCKPGENPMACEYRVHRPSYALIALGTDDNRTPPETYEARMREIIDYTIAQEVVPILATKADNREGDYAFNRIIALLAYEYDLPLWNFWAAVQSLPNHCLSDDRGHLTWANPNHFEYPYNMRYAAVIRTLTALQSLDSVWRGVTP
jgi:hypothetical protein